MIDLEQRHLVDPAARVLADEHRSLNLIYSGFSQTSLPLRTPKETVWRRSGANVTLLIESGMEEDGETPVGLPAGAKARMILIYLQTRAKQTNSRRVELGRSMAEWLQNMGIAAGGKTYAEVRRQARRISACKLTFFLTTESGGVQTQLRHNGGFVDDEILMTSSNPRQLVLWNEEVVLNEMFYRSLLQHPVPLLEAAVRVLASKPMALDIYCWLAWRLHILDEPLSLSWSALYGQFGGGMSLLRQFRPEFQRNLEHALAAYPEANVTVQPGGIVLAPSRSPIDTKSYKAAKIL
ncbi:replication protein RepA [Roseospira marina]|nr:replication protein RepA [Roseospira marina]